jgi:hypothetical protein
MRVVAALIAEVLVDVEDVYDEYSYGNKNPAAVKAFVLAAQAASLAALGDQFHAGQEEVLQSAVFAAVEVVDQSHEAAILHAGVAEELAHVRPLFLLDVGVVVLAIGASNAMSVAEGR